jgi:Flp pilus assembly protein TadB
VATAVVAAALALSGTRAPAITAAPVHPDREALLDAGWRHGLLRWEGLRLAVLAVSALVAVTAAVPLGLALPAAVAPSIWVRARADGARDRGRRAFARVLVAIGSGLRSGLSLPDALRRALGAEEDPLATRSLRAALRSFDLGGGLDEALQAAAERARDVTERVALGTLALGVTERLPRDRLADLVDAVAERAQFALRLDDEVRARAAGARQQQKLLALLVPALAIYLGLTVPSLAATLGSDLGRYVLIPGAAALEIGGIVLGRRIVRDAAR